MIDYTVWRPRPGDLLRVELMIGMVWERRSSVVADIL